MNLQPDTVRHLAFIKYLYNLGIQQSEKPEPLSAASLLNFHDAIESFLHLACERLNIVTNYNTEFMRYFELLKSSLGAELSQAQSMKRLNKGRTELKHHGILPSKLEIESFKAVTTSFFEDNTPMIFGIPFGTISMTDYVQPEQARENLKIAETLIESGQFAEALDNVALAFHHMLNDYETRKRDRFFRSPFFFGERLSFLDSSSMGLDGSRLKRYDRTSMTPEDWLQLDEERKLGEFVDKVKESLEAMQEAIKVLAMGIDYRRYTKFNLFTPDVSQTMDGKFHTYRRQEQELTKADVQFCIEFVVETAVKLQEFDYSLLTIDSSGP